MKYIFHEVRNPLNSLTVGINVLKSNETVCSLENESLLMMDAAAKFMSDTLDNVLNMQRIEEGKFELNFAPFAIDDMMKQIIRIYGGGIQEKLIVLKTEFEVDVPDVVRGDRDRISHILSNLLSNAIKFSPKHSEIVISCKRLSLENGIATISFAVTDHGPGISPENQVKLFNNFVQIRPSKLQNGQVIFFTTSMFIFGIRYQILFVSILIYLID